MTVWHTIKTLDGRTLSSTHNIKGNMWDWIVDVIMGDAECRSIDINMEETEDEGDFITVKGKRYARRTTSLHDA